MTSGLWNRPGGIRWSGIWGMSWKGTTHSQALQYVIRAIRTVTDGTVTIRTVHSQAGMKAFALQVEETLRK